MSSRLSHAGLAIPILSAALACQAQAPAPQPPAPRSPTPQAQAPPSPRPLAAAPAIRAGEPVFDRTGREVGKVQNLMDTTTGPMVVASIDGKLISLPQSTLRMDGPRVVSSQSKDEMLSAAGAPR